MRHTRYDVIIPVTGGLEKYGTPHPWAIRRLDKTLEVWRGEWIVIPGRGTPHRPPPLDKKGFPVDECAASADYLVRHGVNPKRILLERVSLDTIGNAYFTRVLFSDPMKFKKILVVTSEHTMPRTRYLFDWVYSLLPRFGRKIEFISASDEGLDDNLIRLRSKKEKKSLEKLGTLKNRIKNLRDLQKWIFTEHGAYAYGRRVPRLRGKIVATY